MITPEAAKNAEFIGYTDQGGRGDGVQVMVVRGHADACLYTVSWKGA